MNEKKLINLIIALIIIITGVVAYIIFTRPAAAPQKDAPSGVVTISGTIACLPKTGTGNQTMECAIGLKATDNKYYRLKNLPEYDPESKFSTTGQQVKVTGTLKTDDPKGPDGNKYDVAGTIDVTSVKEAR